MSDVVVGIVNYAKKYEGTAIAARLYYDTLRKLGQRVSWYQVADAKDPSAYMNDPTVLYGSKVPISRFRMGYDRMIYLPSAISSQIKEPFVFLADPTLVRVGLQKEAFMIKIHDLIRVSKDSPGLTSNLMFRYVLPRIKYATAVIVTTAFMKKELTGMGLDEERIKVVFEPVDERLELTDQVVGTASFPENKVNLLYVAADRDYKRIDFFLGLAKYFQSKRLENFSFFLVSSIGEKTRRHLQSLHLKNFTLIEEAKDLIAVYKRCHVLVYPSENEGFGRPLVEALALGIPTVARKIQPFIEIIGESGCLLEDNSVESWADAIQEITSQKEYSKFSSRARKRFIEKFSRKSFEKALLDAFGYFVEEIGH